LKEESHISHISFLGDLTL